jgi:hypothetical protein
MKKIVIIDGGPRKNFNTAFSYEGFEYEPTLGEPNYPHFIKQ